MLTCMIFTVEVNIMAFGGGGGGSAMDAWFISQNKKYNYYQWAYKYNKVYDTRSYLSIYKTP